MDFVESMAKNNREPNTEKVLEHIFRQAARGIGFSQNFCPSTSAAAAGAARLSSEATTIDPEEPEGKPLGLGNAGAKKCGSSGIR